MLEIEKRWIDFATQTLKDVRIASYSELMNMASEVVAYNTIPFATINFTVP